MRKSRDLLTAPYVIHSDSSFCQWHTLVAAFESLCKNFSVQSSIHCRNCRCIINSWWKNNKKQGTQTQKTSSNFLSGHTGKFKTGYIVQTRVDFKPEITNTISIAMSSIYNKAGIENYNSPSSCVHVGNTGPVFSHYATSGKRLNVKAQKLNSSTWLVLHTHLTPCSILKFHCDL